MSNLDMLLREQDELQKRIAAAKKEGREEALKTVRRLCKEYGFTSGMLKGVLAQGRKKKGMMM